MAWMVDSLGAAIGLMVAGVFLLGSWPPVWNHCERRGRLPAHTFLDYSITYLVSALLLALTLGQFVGEEGPSFTQQLQQPNGALAAIAAAGGAALGLADMALQWSVALVGLSIGPPILNAVTLILSVIATYFLDGGLNAPQLVFPGMAASAAAILAGMVAHVRASRIAAAAAAPPPPADPEAASVTPSGAEVVAAADRGGDGDGDGGGDGGGSGGYAAAPVGGPSPAVAPVPGANADVVLTSAPAGAAAAAGGKGATSRVSSELGLVQRAGPRVAGQAGSTCGGSGGGGGDGGGRALPTSPQGGQEEKGRPAPAGVRGGRSVKHSTHGPDASSVWLGLGLTVVGGVVCSCFLPAFQIATNDPFAPALAPPGTPPLTIYTAYFYFAMGFTGLSVPLNIALLYRPWRTRRSSVGAWLRDHDCRGWSVLSALLASLGDYTFFHGGQVAGYAAATLVLAYPVVGVLWGLLHFREHRGPGGTACEKRTVLALVVGQAALYGASVALLASSAELRPPE